MNCIRIELFGVLMQRKSLENNHAEEKKTIFLKTVDSLTNTSKKASKIVYSIKNIVSWKEERKISANFY